MAPQRSLLRPQKLGLDPDVQHRPSLRRLAQPPKDTRVGAVRFRIGAPVTVLHDALRGITSGHGVEDLNVGRTRHQALEALV